MLLLCMVQQGQRHWDEVIRGNYQDRSQNKDPIA
ncbi:hypothetical protein F888_02850 [Acinetobacter courvalinii]|jgi:hypothetical protein|uniref:Uncharacterized protein n=1 Tax=Acinetobacter courvalinii TaxID=280147 RepID=N9R5F1_9GAMM|nr:hypothetical protein F888_02850 [Acinetobacter courvalinii]